MTILYQNERYELRIIENALGEDKRTTQRGYGIWNKEHKIMESTFLIYGEARWAVDHMDAMARQLDSDNDTDPLAELGEASTDDVTIN